MKKLSIFIFLLIGIVACGPSAKDGQKERVAPTDAEFFSGSKGSVLWGVYVKQDEKDQKDIFCIRGIDLTTGKISFEIELNDIADAAGYFDPAAGKGGRRIVVGDRIWTIVSEGRLEARNMYTGEILDDNKSLQRKYVELKDGIKSCESAGDMPGYIVHANNGNSFWFNMEKSVMVNLSSIESNLDFVFPEKEFRTLMLEPNGSANIYVEKQRENELSGYRKITSGKKFNELPSAEKDSFIVVKVEAEKPFYKGSVVQRGPMITIVKYSTEPSSGRQQLSALSNFNGKVLWTCTDEAVLKSVVDYHMMSARCKVSMYAKEFLIMKNESPRTAFSIDMTSGKVNWKNDADSLFLNFKE